MAHFYQGPQTVMLLESLPLESTLTWILITQTKYIQAVLKNVQIPHNSATELCMYVLWLKPPSTHFAENLLD